MNTIYITNEKSFYPAVEDTTEPIRKLPVGTYFVTHDMKLGFGFTAMDDMPVPAKVYGNLGRYADRILNTFGDRPAGTGVLLAGEKGSGKTLLSKILSARLRDVGVSTFVINTPYCGDEFNDFIQKYQDPALVLFDEFEKVYNERNRQNQMLTLLDGSFPSKKLYVMTINDSSGLNAMLMNRPGRLYYALKFDGMTDEEVRQYAADNLKDQSQIEALAFACAGFQKLNFDMLSAIVAEMNRYNENPTDAMRMLNARASNEYEARQKYYIDVFNEAGTACTGVHPSVAAGRPFEDGEKSERVHFCDPGKEAYVVIDRESSAFGDTVTESDDDFVALAEQKKLKKRAGLDLYVDFDMSHFDRAASKKGTYVFRKDGYTIAFVPPVQRPTYFD